MDKAPVMVERVYHATTEQVWKALTNNEEIKKWYFQLEEFKPEVGFTFTFSGGADNGPQYLHVCEITQLVPKEKLAYTWRYDGFPGISELTWEINEVPEGTKVKLTHTGLESFAGGWNYFVNDALKNYLEAKA